MLEYLDIAIGFATIMLLLSLVVTAIVHLISTLLDLRGNNLVWALANLFEQMPLKGIHARGTAASGQEKTDTVSTELAKAVAKDSSIAPIKMLSRYKAKAIRPDELKAIVHKLAASPPQDMSKEAKEALLQLVTERVPGKEGTLEQAESVATQLEALFPARAQMVRDTVEQVMGKTQRIAAEIDTWFDTVMDRSADRFARNSKIAAAAVSLVIAFVFQVNAIYLFRQISDNAGVRNQLVAMAQPTLQQAEQFQAQANVPGITLAAMKTEDSYKAQLQNAPDRVTTCAEGVTWITNNVQSPDSIASEFEKRCKQKEFETHLTNISEVSTNLTDTLQKTQLKFKGPDDWKLWQRMSGWLCTAILLSLGAPFWFNLLRQMATLRPPISQKITEEQQAGKD